MCLVGIDIYRTQHQFNTFIPHSLFFSSSHLPNPPIQTSKTLSFSLSFFHSFMVMENPENSNGSLQKRKTRGSLKPQMGHHHHAAASAGVASRRKRRSSETIMKKTKNDKEISDDDDDDEMEEVERKVRALQRIVPGGELLGVDKLFEETAGYILALQSQVKAMKVLESLFLGLEENDKNHMKFGC